MYPSWTLSLSCLGIACVIGFILWAVLLEKRRRKRHREEDLKRQIKEITGDDWVKGHTTVKDLERRYGRKG